MLLFLSFKNGQNSFVKYYMQLVEIKDVNALIGNTPFFDQPIKNQKEPYEKLLEMLINNDCRTGNLD